jgi:hypothetical protein
MSKPKLSDFELDQVELFAGKYHCEIFWREDGALRLKVVTESPELSMRRSPSYMPLPHCGTVSLHSSTGTTRKDDRRKHGTYTQPRGDRNTR